MGLTESKKKDLEDKEFHKLFNKHKPKWEAMAQKAYQFAKESITGGNEPRPDDVAKALRNMVEVDEKFRDHQDENHARSPRYTEWFTEYVIDRVLIQPGGKK